MKSCTNCLGKENTEQDSFCPVCGMFLNIFDGCRLRKKIAEGGYGVVYLGEDVAGDKVAIKLLRPEHRNREEMKLRLLQEVEVLKRFEHPHIVNFLASGDICASHTYLVMEWLAGETLEQVAERDFPDGMPLEQALPLFLQILSALEYAHEQGILHRDVKPSNVMLSKQRGSTYRTKLIDFGIVKKMQSQSSARITQKGRIVGTPQYMSPEQILLKNPLDRRVDVYSSAALLSWMLTGKDLFEGAPMQICSYAFESDRRKHVYSN